MISSTGHITFPNLILIELEDTILQALGFNSICIDPILHGTNNVISDPILHGL